MNLIKIKIFYNGYLVLIVTLAGGLCEPGVGTGQFLKPGFQSPARPGNFGTEFHAPGDFQPGPVPTPAGNLIPREMDFL